MKLPPKLLDLGLSPEEMAALQAHLREGTPIQTLVDILRQHGFEIGATTLKAARKVLRED